MDTRFCRCCSVEKDRSSFYKSSRSSHGMSDYCKECTKRKVNLRTATKRNPPAKITEKFCKSCGETKAIDNFGVSTQCKDGYRPHCRPCVNAKAKQRAFSPSSIATKECAKCCVVMSVEYFNKDKRSPDGYNYACRDCCKHRTLMSKFGISIEEYRILHEKQNGVCFICGQAEKRKGRWGNQDLAVDHCHKTGRVRGLLCAACNTALGLFNEDLSILGSAIRYLEKEKGSGRSNSQTRTRVNGMAKASTSRRGR